MICYPNRTYWKNKECKLNIEQSEKRKGEEHNRSFWMKRGFMCSYVMKLSELLKLVDGVVLVGNDERNIDDIEIEKVAASDLMSDVLALPEPGSLLVTGLATPQCVRTAAVVGTPVVLVVRNRDIMPETKIAAETSGVILCVTKKGMYEVCGLLYEAGLKGAFMERD